MEAVLPAFLVPYFPMIKGVAVGLVIFIVGWILSKIVARVVAGATRRLDVALAKFLASLARYTVLVTTVIAALGSVGLQTTSLVAVFASAGLAVGLALQGSLASFASGVMILFFRPFTIDDMVTVAGYTGVVQDIGLFATTLHTPNNEKIIIPNNKITSDSIQNLTTLGTRRGIVEVGVAYGSDAAKVQEHLLAAAKKVDLVLDDPAPAIAFTSLGASSLDFSVMAWTHSADYLAMLHALRISIYESLNAAEIEIPFNQIVVHNV